jgi:hypothetical protein
VFSIRSDCGIHQRVVRQFSSVETQFSWIRQLAVGIRLKQSQHIRTEMQSEIRLEELASDSSRVSWDQTQAESAQQNRDTVRDKTALVIIRTEARGEPQSVIIARGYELLCGIIVGSAAK